MMHNTIEVFSASCFLCQEAIKTLEIGKCSGCKLIFHNLQRELPREIVEKIKKYKIDAVPSVLINEKIKLVGRNSTPIMCDPEVYKELEKKFSVEEDIK